MRIELYESWLLNDELICYKNIKMDRLYENSNEYIINEIIEMEVD